MTDGFKVQVTDLATGTVEERVVPLHDYFILTTGDCYVDRVGHHANGSAQLTIKGRKAVDRAIDPGYNSVEKAAAAHRAAIEALAKAGPEMWRRKNRGH